MLAIANRVLERARDLAVEAAAAEPLVGDEFELSFVARRRVDLLDRLRGAQMHRRSLRRRVPSQHVVRALL